jgi:hypothetical protein
MEREDAVFYLEELYEYLNENFSNLGIPEEWLIAIEEAVERAE